MSVKMRAALAASEGTQTHDVYPLSSHSISRVVAGGPLTLMKG